MSSSRYEEWHVGRDPNDTTWLVVRYPDDWDAAILDRISFDPARSRLELGVLPPASDFGGPLCGAEGGVGAQTARIWLPLTPVTDEEGNQYRSNPANDLVERRGACDPEFLPMPCFGGHGWETGRLHHPVGLAVDRRGLLYVADACNHRVQVMRPVDGSVLMVLGKTDAYGRPVAGIDLGAMLEPVDVAVDPCHCRLYVADRLGGRIHEYSGRLEWVRSFVAIPGSGFPPGITPMPVGIAVGSDGALLIADAHWPRLLRVRATDGAPLGEVPLREAPAHFAGLEVNQRLAVDGEVIVGPLDSGKYDAAWHEVIVEADTPFGTSIEVQTFAAEDKTALGQFTRTIPVIAQFANHAVEPSSVGPSAGASTLSLGADAVRLVRIGDTIEIDVGQGAPKERVTLSSVPSVQATLRVRGDRALYVAGAQVRLVRRGSPLPGGPRVIRTLTAGETLELSGASEAHPVVSISISHAIGALLRPGDLITLSDGGVHASEVEVVSVAYADTTVSIAPPLTRDARASTVRLVVAPGRLIVDSLSSYVLPADPDETITVMGTGPVAVTTTPYLAEHDTGALWVDAAPLTGAAVDFESFTRFVSSPHVPWAPARPVPIDLVHDGRLEADAGHPDGAQSGRQDRTVEAGGTEAATAQPGRHRDLTTNAAGSEEKSYRRLVLSDTARGERANASPFARSRPVLASYTGLASDPRSTGPAAGETTMVLPASAMGLVRVGDTVQLSRGALAPSASSMQSIAALPACAVTLFIEGHPAAPLPTYTQGAIVRLIERDGRPLPGAPRSLYQFGAGDIADFGSAPVDGAAATIAFPHGAAAFFHQGDVCAIVGPSAQVVFVVSSIAWAPAVSFSWLGSQTRYGSGTTLTVRERGGRPLPRPILLYTLSPGEAIDLSPSLPGMATVAFPNVAAASFRQGDVIDVDDGTSHTSLSIRSIALDASVVGLGAPADSDYRAGTVRLEVTPGRLIAKALLGFDDPTPLQEPLEVTGDNGRTVSTTVRLAEPDRGAVWVDPAPLSGTLDVAFANWMTFAAPGARATDRGQFLWVRVRLIGRKRHPGDLFSVDSPVLRSLRLSYSRPSLLKLLPSTFSRRDDQRDFTGALFLERFLTLFEGQLTSIESLYEGFSRHLNATAASPEWLAWIASWLDLAFNPSWPIDKRRALVLRAMDLYRRRGTVASILDWIEIYTSERPALVEGFSTRIPKGTVLSRSATLGCTPLFAESGGACGCACGHGAASSCAGGCACGHGAASSCTGGCACERQKGGEGGAHHFTVYVPLADVCARSDVERAIRAIVEAIKPAHTSFDLRMVLPEARIGIQSTVGLDMMLGDDAPPSPSVLGLGVPPSTGGRYRPVVGLDLFLESGSRPRAYEPGLLGSDRVRVETNLTLK